MTHFYNPPRKWQPEEIEILHRMMKDNATPEQARYVLPHRTLLSIEGRMKWERMDSEQHAKRRKRVNKQRTKDNMKIFKNARGAYIDHSVGSKASDDLLKLRDERAKIQHATLTSAFFGDPLPGYSALDKRSEA